MRYWPLTQLTITTPDLILRVPDDQLLDDLAHLAGQGVHLPGATVFPQPWTSGTPDEVADNVLRNHWWARADWRGSNWRLHPHRRPPRRARDRAAEPLRPRLLRHP